MKTVIKPTKITRENFATYGDLISSDSIKPININAGYAKRFDNLAKLILRKTRAKLLLVFFQL